MKLYRYYRAEYGLEVLKGLSIRTSHPESLNDPFELAPNIDPAQFTFENLKATLQSDHFIDRAHNADRENSGILSKEQFKRHYLEKVEERANNMLANITEHAEAVRSQFARIASRHLRFICASQTNTSILMWSHYADNHRGVIIEFSDSQPTFSYLRDSIIPVTYSEAKPDFVFGDTPAFTQDLRKVATTKSPDWSYEREVRILVFNHPDILKDGQHLEIHSSAIVAVYLGARISDEHRSEFIKACADAPLNHVVVHEMALHPSEYNLTYEALEKPHSTLG